MTYTLDVEVVKVFGYLEKIKNKGGGWIKSYNMESGLKRKGGNKENLNFGSAQKPSQPLQP